MRQNNRCFQWTLTFFFLILANTGNLTAQEHGRIIIIKGCPQFDWSFPNMVILNARDHGEIIKAFQEGREDTLFIAATEAEKLIEQEDIVVGILHAIQDNDITEKPWNGLGLYYVLLIDESISYISKTKKNMGTEVILLSFSDFVENAELH